MEPNTRSPIPPSVRRFNVICLYFKSQASFVHEPESVLRCGSWGIRTPGCLSTSLVFKTSAIDRSAKLPNKEKVSGLSRFLIRCNKWRLPTINPFSVINTLYFLITASLLFLLAVYHGFEPRLPHRQWGVLTTTLIDQILWTVPDLNWGLKLAKLPC